MGKYHGQTGTARILNLCPQKIPEHFDFHIRFEKWTPQLKSGKPKLFENASSVQIYGIALIGNPSVLEFSGDTDSES